MTSNSMMSDYMQLNTVPALAGVLFAISSAVQFLGAKVSIATPAYTFPSAHALLVSLAMLALAFASSDTKDWRRYDSWEQGIVAAAAVLMIGAEYTTQVSDLIANNSPTAGVLAFVISFGAWGVLAR